MARLWEASVIESDLGNGIEMSDYFDADEIEELIAAATAVAQVDAALEGEGANGARGVTMDAARQIKVVMYADSVLEFERALKATGLDVRADALMVISRFYLEHHPAADEAAG